MDSKPKAHSASGTPLTIKWTGGSIEGEACETEPGVNIRRLAILVSGFVSGLGVFGLPTWFLGERPRIVDALLVGIVSCLWVQRWGEKHLGWQTAESKEEGTRSLSATQIKKRRLKYSLSGGAIGVAAAVLAAWFQGEINWRIFEAVMAALAGYDIAVRLGERFRGLPTLNDLAVVRMREEMSPLDLKRDDPVPLTLKTGGEVRAKR